MENPDKPGTFVTNFGEESRPVYEAAIAKHGDPHLVIREPYQPPNLRCDVREVLGQNAGSLHDISGERRSLSPFWRIFDDLKQRAA